MRLGFKYNDIDLVRQDIKSQMPLDQFIILADKRYTDETGIKCNPLEEVISTVLSVQSAAALVLSSSL